ncbi:MAG: formylglycine-generating enzyme family protein [Candidatus Brocadiia bacterium]
MSSGKAPSGGDTSKTGKEPKGERAAGAKSVQPNAKHREQEKNPGYFLYRQWPFDRAEAKRRQQETGETLAMPVIRTVRLDGSVKVKFVLIPAGRFTMGSEECPEGTKPVHGVLITKPFYMAMTEVTQAQWRAVMGSSPWKGEKHEGDSTDVPANYITWEEAEKFCKKLSQSTGKPIKLPTEAQWEYACRAGSGSAYGFGDDKSRLKEYGWFFMNSGDQVLSEGTQWGPKKALLEWGCRARAVGQKKPNNWGLYDMHGNVCEWCRDWYDGDWYEKRTSTDPTGPKQGKFRVMRSGSWYLPGPNCRSARRAAFKPAESLFSSGFRPILSLSEQKDTGGARQGMGKESGGGKTVKREPAKPESAATDQKSEPGSVVYTEWPFNAAEAKRRQQETAEALQTPVQRALKLDGRTRIKFILIPAGKFTMGGSAPAEKTAERYGGEARVFGDEHPQHQVIITKPFYMSATEVTQEQYEAVMELNPSRFKSPENPVEYLDWSNAKDFCEKLSKKAGKTVRLPTEAQWEYACRAGSKTAFCFGGDKSDLPHYAWFYRNSGDKLLPEGTERSAKKCEELHCQPHPVAKKKPNNWGLYDMHGNVWEWCRDWSDEDYYEKSPKRNPTGPGNGSMRILRGGSWNFCAWQCRSGHRFMMFPWICACTYGFRVVMSPKP